MEKLLSDKQKLDLVYKKLGLHHAVTKEEERLVDEELERCKDQYYFYINYFTVDGKKPTISREDFYNYFYDASETPKEVYKTIRKRRTR
jgi:hypothetical protein